jgi:hypothetical protein
MSADEPFLARWSRRKREATREPEPKAPQDAAAPPRPPAEPKGEAPVGPAVQLPALDSITAETDIRPFLAPGVPEALRRAALRRAWSADPAIRDFVGLAENSWDFTAPEGVPGFGPLSAEEVQRLLRLAGGDGATGEEREAPASGKGPMTSPDRTGRGQEDGTVPKDAAADQVGVAEDNAGGLPTT